MPYSIFVQPLGSLGVNCVAIVNEQTKTLILFDAPLGVDEFLKSFPDYSVEALFFTHGHFDHILGFSSIAKLPRQIFAHEGDRMFFEKPQVMAPWMDPDEVPLLTPVSPTRWLKDAETITFSGLQIEARPTPGHSQGGVVYYIPSLKLAIVGDTIFCGSIGRTDLPGCSQETLLKSIREQVLTLPEDTVLIPGHGPKTTVEFEKANNSYLG